VHLTGRSPAGSTLSATNVTVVPKGATTVTQAAIAGTSTSASVKADGTWSDGVEKWKTGTVKLKGDCAPPPPPPSTVTPVAPSASAMTCVGTTPANGSITVTPVAGVVYTLAGHTLSGDTFADLPAGSYTVVASPASKAYTLAGAANDGTVSFVVTVAVSGSLSSTCPAVEGQLGSYTLTLANAASSAEAVLFRISENGTVVATSAAVASGAGYSYAGSLSAGSAVTIKADYSADAGATWASVVIANPASIVCPSVLGQEFVDQPNPPAATLPYTGVPVLPMLAIGFGLVIVGALLVRSARVARVSGC